MLVNGVSKQAFGSSQVYRDVLLGKRNFYSLGTDDKLNVIYDKLNSLENDHRGLSENQQIMHKSNMQALIWLASANNDDVVASSISDKLFHKIDLVG